MLAAQRLDMIADMISKNGSVVVEDLARQMNVSAMTIRRDLKQLCEEGRAERHYGGAKLPAYVRSEIDYEKKATQNCEEKQRIARAAIKLIQPEDAIFLDGGTTTCEIAHLLCSADMHLSVVTNDLQIALILCEAQVDLMILGGMVQKNTRCTMGHASEQFLRQLRVSKAFIGSSSIDHQFNTFSPTYDKAYLKKSVTQISSKSYLVADSSKFSMQAMCLVGPLSDFDGVITGHEFTVQEQQQLKDLGIHIICA